MIPQANPPNDNDDKDDEADLTLRDEDATLQAQTPQAYSPRALRDRLEIRVPDRLVYGMLAEINELHTFKEAIDSGEVQHWQDAMNEEMASLEENLTWYLVKLPKGL